MVNHMCLNATALNVEAFTKPSLVSGYLIAGAIAVCLALMLYDIVDALCQHRYWFPCRLFPLGSITIGLIMLSTKIVNNRTTIMPTALDQLSKLTGSAMICIYSGFFMPSLGTMRPYESASNMLSWIILVITAIVDIYTQIRTGLIFRLPVFIVEHFIIMFCNIALIPLLVYCSIHIFQEKEVSSDLHGDLLKKAPGSMLNRLRYCSICSYISNPQFILCRTPSTAIVGGLCSLCALITLEAALRSRFLREGMICEVLSSYEESVMVVVVIQMVFVLVGAIAIFVRVFTSLYHLHFHHSYKNLKDEVEHLKLQFMFYNGNLAELVSRTVIVLVLVGVLCSMALMALPAFIFSTQLDMLSKLSKTKKETNQQLQTALESHGIYTEKWISGKGQEDFERWIKKNVKHSVDKLGKFLSQNQSLHADSMEQDGQMTLPGYRVSCLSLVILAKFAVDENANLHDRGLIVQTMDEVYEIIYFIDEKTFESKAETRRKRRFTKVWSGGTWSRNIRCFGIGRLPAGAKKLTRRDENDRFGFVGDEVKVVNYLIDQYGGNEMQLLADMLRCFLAKLPIAIYKDLAECRPEHYEKQVKVAIKFLSKLNSVKGQISWEFPRETGITTLINKLHKPQGRDEGGSLDVDDDW